MKQLILFFLLLVSGVSFAQVKTALSNASVTVTTGTLTKANLVDAQDSVLVYGTFAQWKRAHGSATAVTKGAIIKVGLDSLKTYKNLFLNVEGSARVAISVSANDTTYHPVRRGFVSGHASAALWRTVPINRSVRYVRFEFLSVGSRFRFHEFTVTK